MRKQGHFGVRRLVAALVCGGLAPQLFESGRDKSRATKAVTSYRNAKRERAAAPNRLQLSLLSRSKPFTYHAPLNCARGGLTMKHSSLIPVERIEKAIYLIRSEKVMLDRDLADLYGVPTKAFNQAVKRHQDRFPPDFMFQLTMQEAREWWSEETARRLTDIVLREPMGEETGGGQAERRPPAWFPVVCDHRLLSRSPSGCPDVLHKPIR